MQCRIVPPVYSLQLTHQDHDRSHLLGTCHSHELPSVPCLSLLVAQAQGLVGYDSKLHHHHRASKSYHLINNSLSAVPNLCVTQIEPLVITRAAAARALGLRRSKGCHLLLTRSRK
jgi:hypothetical protein